MDFQKFKLLCEASSDDVKLLDDYEYALTTLKNIKRFLDLQVEYITKVNEIGIPGVIGSDNKWTIDGVENIGTSGRASLVIKNISEKIVAYKKWVETIDSMQLLKRHDEIVDALKSQKDTYTMDLPFDSEPEETSEPFLPKPLYTKLKKVLKSYNFDVKLADDRERICALSQSLKDIILSDFTGGAKDTLSRFMTK